MEVLGALLDVLFPARCVGCGAPPRVLCPRCLARARLAGTASLPRPPGVDWWVAAFAYEGPVREALARLKYGNARSALPVLAAALVDRLREEGPGPIDVVTWPPTTGLRRRHRGFDQAEHLARAVGRALAVPVRSCLVRRAGPSQTGRSAAQRRRGPAFEAVGGVGGLAVLVVDDVATTGATLAAAARALRSSGARRVGAAAVARTPRRGVEAPGGGGVRIGHGRLKRPPPGAVIRCEARCDSGRVSLGESREERWNASTLSPPTATM